MKMMYKTILLKNSITNVIEELRNIKGQLSETGNVFCYVKNEYDEDNCVKKDIFDVMEFGTNIGLSYVNTIIAPESTTKTYDNIQYIIWFAKDKKHMYFNKDAIREKHIWKDVEWGKREKNYNPKGKDPGNVWIPTLDDGKGKITEHLLLNRNEIYNRILSATTQENETIFLLSDNKQDSKYKFKNNRIVFKFIQNTERSLQDNFIKEKVKNNTEINSKAKVIFGTSEDMKKVQNESVKLIVTSPPYWDLKNYFKENQIGQETYEKYTYRMDIVWKECYKKLTQDGSMWININVRVKNNQPIYLPKLFIKQCKKIGFFFRGILIWHKSSGIPTSAINIVDRHEYVLIFSKSKKNRIKSLKENDFEDYKNPNINKGLIWNINRKAGSVGKNTIHPAIYPTELINRIIKLASNENDIVLDPFLGSGTSLIAAINNNRNFIGYEFNEGFQELMADRYKNEIEKDSKNIIEYIYSI